MKWMETRLSGLATDLMLAAGLLAAFLACADAPASAPPPNTAANDPPKSAAEQCSDNCGQMHESCLAPCQNINVLENREAFDACQDRCDGPVNACIQACYNPPAANPPPVANALPAETPAAAPPDNTPTPAQDNAPGAAEATAAASAGDCSGCEAQCSGEKQQCQGGSMSGCYRAAACLCACNQAHGGCGSSPEALQQCVDDNNAKAASLGSNAPTVSQGPVLRPPPAPPPPPPRAQPSACPPGYRDCGVDHGKRVCLAPGSTACPAF